MTMISSIFSLKAQSLDLISQMIFFMNQCVCFVFYFIVQSDFFNFVFYICALQMIAFNSDVTLLQQKIGQ